MADLLMKKMDFEIPLKFSKWSGSSIFLFFALMHTLSMHDGAVHKYLHANYQSMFYFDRLEKYTNDSAFGSLFFQKNIVCISNRLFAFELEYCLQNMVWIFSALCISGTKTNTYLLNIKTKSTVIGRISHVSVTYKLVVSKSKVIKSMIFKKNNYVQYDYKWKLKW